MRIQRLLSQMGVASRRGAEKAIAAGQVRVNGQVIELGHAVTIGDSIDYAGKIIAIKAKHLQSKSLEVLLYHKPVGQICSRKDDKDRPLVFDYLPTGQHWFMVGRLDVNTSGLLLFCNRGDVTHKLMHPSSNIQRYYELKTERPLSTAEITQLCQGVTLEDGQGRFLKLQTKGSHRAWYQATLGEGRNRLVRRLIEHTGTYVTKLRRTGYGSLRMPKTLAQASWQLANKKQLSALKQQINFNE
jgi:23S rRNA pseudouridine2605 synthase